MACTLGGRRTSGSRLSFFSAQSNRWLCESFPLCPETVPRARPYPNNCSHWPPCGMRSNRRRPHAYHGLPPTSSRDPCKIHSSSPSGTGASLPPIRSTCTLPCQTASRSYSKGPTTTGVVPRFRSHTLTANLRPFGTFFAACDTLLKSPSNTTHLWVTTSW